MLRTISCALLAVTNTRWLLYYIAADMGLFFLYKIARRDFFYFTNLSGIVRLMTSVLEVRIKIRFFLLLIFNSTLSLFS